MTLPSGEVPLWIYRDLVKVGNITSAVPYPTQLPFGHTNWNTSQSKSGWQFAWNVMAGVSYDVSQNLKIDLGYRYLNVGKYSGFASYGATNFPVSREITAQEVRLGVRVTTN